MTLKTSHLEMQGWNLGVRGSEWEGGVCPSLEGTGGGAYHSHMAGITWYRQRHGKGSFQGSSFWSIDQILSAHRVRVNVPRAPGVFLTPGSLCGVALGSLLCGCTRRRDPHAVQMSFGEMKRLKIHIILVS